LVEPVLRDMNGCIVFFKIHDVLHDLGICIVEDENSFHCRVGQGLRTLNADECFGWNQLLLSSNKLSSLPKSMRVLGLCSLLMDGNKDLTKNPKRVIGSMLSMKVLNLSGTSTRSFPESVGYLK
jgi:hypothetical protein